MLARAGCRTKTPLASTSRFVPLRTSHPSPGLLHFLRRQLSISNPSTSSPVASVNERHGPFRLPHRQAGRRAYVGAAALPPLEAASFVEHPTESRKNSESVQAQRGNLMVALKSLLTQFHPQADAIQQLSYIRAAAESMGLMGDPRLISRLARAYARYHDATRAINLLKFSYKDGARLTLQDYQSICVHFASAREWSHVKMTTTLAKEHLGQTSTRLLNWRTRALAELQNYTELRTILDHFAREGLSPTRMTFHFLIYACLRNCDLHGARSFMEKMEAMDIAPSATTHSTMLLESRLLDVDAESTIQAMERASSDTPKDRVALLNAQIQLRIDKGDIDGAVRIMKNFGPVQPDSTGPPSEPDGLANPDDELSSLGEAAVPHPVSPPSLSLDPSLTTYIVLINYCVRCRDFDRAVLLCQHMTSLGLVPNDSVVAAIIRGCVDVGRSDEAINLVARMCWGDAHSPAAAGFLTSLNSRPIPSTLPPELSTVQVTTRIFNALLKVVLSTRGYDEAIALLGHMHSLNIEPDAYTIRSILDFLGSETDLHPNALVDAYYELMRKGHVRPTIEHVNILLESVLKTPNMGINHSPCVRGYAPPLEPIFNNRSIRPTIPSSYSTITSTIGEIFRVSGLMSKLNPVLSSLVARGVKSDHITYGLRLQYDARASPQSALSTFRDMVAQGIKPTAMHYIPLMHAYASSGQMKSAMTIMKLAISAGVVGTAVMFTILIVGYGNIGRPDISRQVFSDMVAAGVAPDEAILNALGSAYRDSGRLAEARRAMLDFWPLVARPQPELKDMSLKALFYVLKGLGVKRRRTGKVGQVRRTVTKGMVRKIVKMVGNDGGHDVPRRSNRTRRTHPPVVAMTPD